MKKNVFFLIILYWVLCFPGFSYGHNDKQTRETHVPVIEVFRKLEKSTNTHFFYSNTDLENLKVDETKINYKSLKESLKYLSEAYALEFHIKNNVVSVRYSDPKTDKPVKGKVLDRQGKAIEGARVKIKNTHQETYTDAGGNFLLSADHDATVILVVSSFGYESREVPVTGPEITIELREKISELREFIVTGFKQSVARAVDEKKEAINLVDVIVAEDIAKFPQSNMAEALQRISGIQIRRDYAGGVGNEVSVRGLPPEYTNVTVDGQSAPNSSDGRTFNFNTLPAELYAKVEVHKSPSANLDEGGVGGTVNLVKLTPFKLKKPTLIASLEGQYNTQSQDLKGVTPKASLTLGKNWNNKIGLLGGVSYNKFYNTSESYDVVRYTSYSYDINGDQVVDHPNVRVPYPRYVSEGQVVERTAFNLATQFRVTRNFDMLLSGNYIKNTQTSSRYTPIFNIQTNKAAEIQAEGNYLLYGLYNNVTATLENQQSINLTDILQLGAAGNLDLGPWKIKLLGQYSATGKDSEQYRAYANTRSNVSYDIRENYKWFDLNTSAGLTDPSKYTMTEVRRYFWDNEDKILAGQMDVNRKLGGFFTLDAGIKQQNRTKSREQFYRRINNINQPFEPVSRLLEGFLDNVKGAKGPNSFLVHDWDKTYELYGSRIMLEGAEEVNAAYHVSEDVSAGYLMGTFVKGKVKGNAGVRLMKTRLTSEGFERNQAGELSPLTVKSDYTDVLPSMNLRYAPLENLFLRVAYAKVLTRPALGDLAAFRQVNDVDLTIVQKNPHLKPFRAHQYDLGVEWYPRAATLLGISFFRKDIASFIVNQTSEVPMNGQIYRLSQPVNGNSARIDGIEFNYQQPFSFLPGLLSGLGVITNYTLSKSSFREVLDLGTGETETYEMPNNSKHSANATLYYDKGGFEFRIANNYRSRFLREKPVPADGLKYRDAYHQTDISLSYAFTRQLTLTFHMLNAFNSEPYEYIWEKKYMDQVAVYGRSYQAGLRFKL